jgi:neopullulanase
MKQIIILLCLFASITACQLTKPKSTTPATTTTAATKKVDPKDDPQQRQPDGVKIPEYKRIDATGTRTVKGRVDPAFWWIGMNNPEVELMIHDVKISDSSVEINYPGVSIKEIFRLENPNYLFVVLNIDPNTKAGKFNIVLKSNNGFKSIEYELRDRNRSVVKAQGLDNSDFIYLVMPDRFSNGDLTNDTYTDMNQQGVNRKKMYFRHGGDIQGVMNHVDYLKDLGVTALWLNPVLENDQPYESYHGYAITDHYNIDKRFGNNELYVKMVEKCHQNGIKVVKDMVYNHVGLDHYFIKDLPSKDWIHQFDTYTKTNYREQTHFDPYASAADKSDMTDGWFDKHMPDINNKNPRLAKYLIQNAIWWIEYSNIDSYRIDTWIYPDQKFMKDWCEAINKEYPKFFKFGEAWVQGNSNQAFFTQNSKLKDVWNSGLESVTDFQMNYAIQEAVSKPSGWNEGTARIYNTLANDYLYENAYRNVTFLDNHDMNRIYSVVGEDQTKLRSAIALLMTMRGIPQLYYGTEILMKNFSDPDGKVREDFPGGWKGDIKNKFTGRGRSVDENMMYTYVKRLAEYRHTERVLQDGKLMQFIPKDNIYVYFRYNENKTVMVVYNPTDKEIVLNTDRFKEMTSKFMSAKNICNDKIIASIANFKVAKFETMVLELKP